MVKVRFAPSPTGYLHIGGARTALFNWMYAKATGGQFVLRIEDTDQVRSKKEYEDEIMDSMQWLGLSWDELYKQSDRFDIYREHAQKLIDEGKAYKDGEAVLLKMPVKEIKIYDLIRGEIDFDTANFVERDDKMKPILDENGNTRLKDEVLMKADGSPAYSFCCAIDDALMGITCVVRGEDHIPNTPKQIIIYEALGFKPPKFAHLPLITGEDGSRMSKRTGAVAVTDYRKQGFLSSGLVNYLMLLGWAPGNNQEVITMDSALKKFSIKKINKAAAAFSMDKLTWINSQHIRSMEVNKLTDLLVPLLREKNYIDESFDRSELENIVNLFKGRLSTLNDFLNWADFAFIDGLNYDEGAKEKHLADDRSKEFGLLAERFEGVENFEAASAETAFKGLVEELGIKPGDLVHPVRVALTGHTNGPSLFEVIALLGKEKTVSRLKNAF